MERNETRRVSEEQAMREVQTLLNEWKAPEPSAWFDTRMAARLHEEMVRPPEGFFARLRDRFLFNGNLGARPMLAGALALVMAAAGGSYVGVAHYSALAHPPAASATVQDLQIIDNNEQAIQQMDQLLDSSSDDGDQPAT